MDVNGIVFVWKILVIYFQHNQFVYKINKMDYIHVNGVIINVVLNYVVI